MRPTRSQKKKRAPTNTPAAEPTKETTPVEDKKEATAHEAATTTTLSHTAEVRDLLKSIMLLARLVLKTQDDLPCQKEYAESCLRDSCTHLKTRCGLSLLEVERLGDKIAEEVRDTLRLRGEEMSVEEWEGRWEGRWAEE